MAGLRHQRTLAPPCAHRRPLLLAVACCLCLAHGELSAQQLAPPTIYQAPTDMIPGFMNGEALCKDLTLVTPNTAPYEPTFTLGAGAVLLERSKPAHAYGTVALDNTTSAVRLDVGQLAPDWRTGTTVFGRWDFHNGWDIEYRFLGLDGWNASRSVSDPGNLQLPLFSAGNPFDQATARYDARLFSHELNTQLGGDGSSWRLIGGVRFAQVYDDANLQARGGAANGNVHVAARNYLYGPQAGIGFGKTFGQSQRWSVDGRFCSALCGSWNRVRTNASGNVSPRIVDRTDTHATFLGEADIAIRYRFSKHWAAYAGYEALYIAGIAEAWDVYTSPDPGRQMTRACPFYHGATAGVEFRW